MKQLEKFAYHLVLCIVTSLTVVSLTDMFHFARCHVLFCGLSACCLSVEELSQTGRRGCFLKTQTISLNSLIHSLFFTTTDKVLPVVSNWEFRTSITRNSETLISVHIKHSKNNHLEGSGQRFDVGAPLTSITHTCIDHLTGLIGAQWINNITIYTVRKSSSWLQRDTNIIYIFSCFFLFYCVNTFIS